MTSQVRVRLSAELGTGDIVRTPLQKLAVVRGHRGMHVMLSYCDEDGEVLPDDDGDGMALVCSLLSLVRKAPPHVSPSFMARGHGR